MADTIHAGEGFTGDIEELSLLTPRYDSWLEAPRGERMEMHHDRWNLARGSGTWAGKRAGFRWLDARWTLAP